MGPGNSLGCLPRSGLKGRCHPTVFNRCVHQGSEWPSWTQRHESAFRSIIDRLCNAPVLAHPQINEENFMYTDYSGKCLGAVLTQKFPEGERPIQFISHKLSSSQQKWPPVVGECYSIFWALQKFRPYLYWCKKVTCFTDHKPLVYWQTANYDSNRLIQRWLLSFQEEEQVYYTSRFGFLGF